MKEIIWSVKYKSGGGVIDKFVRRISYALSARKNFYWQITGLIKVPRTVGNHVFFILFIYLFLFIFFFLS